MSVDSDRSDKSNHSDFEQFIKTAFEEFDLVPSLICIINKHPTYEDIKFPIIASYVRSMEKNPSSCYNLPMALKKLEILLSNVDDKLINTVYFNADFSKANTYGMKKSCFSTISYLGYQSNFICPRSLPCTQTLRRV